jgi:hypothetical protein
MQREAYTAGNLMMVLIILAVLVVVIMMMMKESRRPEWDFLLPRAWHRKSRRRDVLEKKTKCVTTGSGR